MFIIDNERKLEKKTAYAELSILPLSIIMVFIAYWQEVYLYNIIFVILFLTVYCFLVYLSIRACIKGYKRLREIKQRESGKVKISAIQ